MGAGAALVINYRRQRLSEAENSRKETRLFTERFEGASEKLGSEYAAVRLAGVHALAPVADGAPSRELRQMCIDVLCAYLCLKTPAKRNTSSISNAPSGSPRFGRCVTPSSASSVDGSARMPLSPGRAATSTSPGSFLTAATSPMPMSPEVASHQQQDGLHRRDVLRRHSGLHRRS